MYVFSPLFPPVKYLDTPIASIQAYLNAVEVKNAHIVYEHAFDFLSEQKHSENNFSNYKSEICVFLNYVWAVLGKDVVDINRKDMAGFIEFCSAPPTELITSKPYNVIDPKSDPLYPEINENWRPFYSKKTVYQRNEASLKRQLSVISSFFTYLADQDYCHHNPAALALRRLSGAQTANLSVTDDTKDKALSPLQCRYLFKTIESLTKENPAHYERSRFLIYLMIFCYPRVSELAARMWYSPKMSNFKRVREEDKEYVTFFIPRSKGGRSREIVVPEIVVVALARYRKHLGCDTNFPLADDDSPLFVRHKATSAGREAGILDANLSKGRLRDLVNEAFEQTALVMIDDGYAEEATELRMLSSHACRHTGISWELYAERNPAEIMLESGHSTMAMLDKYKSKRTSLRVHSKDMRTDYARGVFGIPNFDKTDSYSNVSGSTPKDSMSE